MIPPQAWAVPTVSLPLPLILGDRRFGIGEAGEPAGWPMPHVVGHGCRFLLLGRGLGLGLRLGPLTCMHDDKAPALLRDLPIPLCDLPLAAHAVAMPAPGRFVLRSPGLCDEPGQGGVLLAPGCEGLADGTGTRD